MKAMRLAATLAALFVLCAAPVGAQVARKTINLVTSDGFVSTSGGIDTTAAGMADSSLYIPTGLYQRGYLFLKPSRPCRVAIAVYGAPSCDSCAVVNPDTSNVMVWPWSGAREFAADSLSMREVTGPTSVVAASYEMVYEFPAAASGKWGAPRGREIALHSPVTGEWYWNNFTRIRLRVLSASGVVTWIARYKGVAW